MVEDKLIVAGGVLLLTVGFIRATINNQPLTPILSGSIVFVFLAAGLSLIPGLKGLIAAFMILVVVSVLLNQLPDLLSKVGK